MTNLCPYCLNIYKDLSNLYSVIDLISNLQGIYNGNEFIKGPINIVIEDNKIQEISSNERLGKNIIDGKGKLACIPFCDAHTHAIFSGDRFFELDMKIRGKSYSEILAQGGGIKRSMEMSRNASNIELKSLLTKRLDTMMQHGTQHVEIKTGYALNHIDELRHLTILNDLKQTHPMNISVTYGGAHVPPPDMSKNEYVNEIIENTLPQINQQQLADSTDVFCDKGAFTVDDTREIFTKSKQLGIPVRVHAEELEYTGIAKIAAKEFGALSADHLLKAKKDDFQILEKYGTSATFMPLAPIGLFSNDTPEGWNETSVDIALGSDFNPNNWIISMQTAVRMAVYRYKMTPLQAFRASTLGSKKAITGNFGENLKEGSDASLNLIKANSLEEFCSKIGQNLVTEVVLHGKIIHKNLNLIA